MSSSKSTATPRNQADTTAEDLKTLLHEAEQALSRAGDNVSDDVQALRERLRDALANGQATMKNLTAAARRQALQADETIRSHPYQAIGVAAGLGLLVGYMISRGCGTRH
ncbi:MAG: DUF883 domain-containing protein [Opitutaceae bacterium]|nr:DUF883 domain-containing protein [Opitutaceae bacterium]